MERILVFLGALLATLVLIKAIPRLPFASAANTETSGRPTMSPAELKFYQVLLQSIPGGYEVWAKAQLSQYGVPCSGFVDFLITQGGDKSPALIVDFDDITPLGLRNEGPDVTLMTSLPVLRIPMAGEYCLPSIRARVNQALQPESARRVA